MMMKRDTEGVSFDGIVTTLYDSEEHFFARGVANSDCSTYLPLLFTSLSDLLVVTSVFVQHASQILP